jgi:hypothetical protein
MSISCGYNASTWLREHKENIVNEIIGRAENG